MKHMALFGKTTHGSRKRNSMFIEEAKNMSPVTAIIMAYEVGTITQYEMVGRLIQQATETQPSKMNLPFSLLEKIKDKTSDPRPIKVAGLELTKEESAKLADKFNEGARIRREYFESDTPMICDPQHIIGE